MTRILRARLAALAAAGGLAATVTAAHAQPPAEVPPAPAPVQPAPADLPPAAEPQPQPQPVPAPAAEVPAQPQTAPAPRVVRWPGGTVILDDPAGPEVIGRRPLPGRKSVNVVTGSGNGFGNTIVVDGGPGGLTVVKSARNGVGNRLVVNPADELFDLDLDDDLLGLIRPAVRPAPAAPVAPKVYRGKANPFWTKKAFSDAHDCNLYWSPPDRSWFRYSADDDSYRPVTGGPAPPAQ